MGCPLCWHVSLSADFYYFELRCKLNRVRLCNVVNDGRRGISKHRKQLMKHSLIKHSHTQSIIITKNFRICHIMDIKQNHGLKILYKHELHVFSCALALYNWSKQARIHRNVRNPYTHTHTACHCLALPFNLCPPHSGLRAAQPAHGNSKAALVPLSHLVLSVCG